jgi:hypothetical protein
MATKNHIIIHISQLEKAQLLDYEGDLTEDIFGIEDSEFLKLHDKLHYKFQARYHVGGIEIKGKAWTGIESKCGRCLEPVKELLEVKLQLFFDKINDIEE